MIVALDGNNVYLQTDSIGNKVMIQQGINNSLTLAENTGTATLLKAPVHPTPPTSANDTQSATTEYVRAYCQTLNIGSTIADQYSMISGIKASTCSLDCVLTNTGLSLTTTDVIFTAIYLTAGVQFNKYNIIAASTSAVPLRFALFNPNGDYVSNSDTETYNINTTTSDEILTSTLTNTVTITSTGVHYIFYQSNAVVAENKYYSSVSKVYSNIINYWRTTTGTISSNGPFRSFYISGASNSINPSTYGNIGTKPITGGLLLINFIFLTL